MDSIPNKIYYIKDYETYIKTLEQSDLDFDKFRELPLELQNNLEIMRKIIQTDARLIQEMNISQKTLEFITQLVKDTECLDHLNEDTVISLIRNNKTLINNMSLDKLIKIIKKDINIIKIIGKEIKEDIIIRLIKEIPEILSLIDYNLMTKDFFDKLLSVFKVKDDKETLKKIIRLLINDSTYYECIKEYIEYYYDDPEIMSMSNDFIKYLQEETGLVKQYNINNKLKLYHFCVETNKLDDIYMTDYIEYVFIDTIRTDLDSKIDDILINDSDTIVIFIDFCNSDLIQLLNKKIKNITTLRKNIKIINALDNPDLRLLDNIYFYKVINIWINYYDEKYKLLLYNNNIYFEEDDDQTVHRIIKVNSQISTKLLLIHWLIQLINTPKYLNNRLSQIGGTCWLSAILNSILLVYDIRDVLEFRYKQYCVEEKNKCDLIYNEFRDETKFDKIEDLIFSLLNNYFNGIKSYKNEDYLLPLAALLKGLSNDEFKQFESDIDIDKPIKHNYLLCKSTEDNPLKTKYCDNQLKIEELNKLNKICQYKDEKTICDTYPVNSDESTGYIYGNSGWAYNVLYLFKKIFSINIEFNKPFILPTSKGVKKVLIIDENFNGNIQSINVNLKLLSAYIEMNNGKHTICGINTDIGPIIYDSNNIWSFDDWTRLSFNRTSELPQYNKKLQKKYPKTYKVNKGLGKIGYKIYISS